MINGWKILRSGRFTDFAIIAGITLLFLSMIALNVDLIFQMTSNQTEEIGRMQLESIRSELEGKIIDSKNATVQLAEEAENLLAAGISLDELENFIVRKKREQQILFNGVCFNTYIASKSFTIIPDFDMPDNYHAVERLWYKGAAENPGQIYITEPYVDAAGNGTCFTISLMLSDKNTVVAMDFTFEDMQDSILQMTAGSNRSALIVSKNGTIIGYTDMSLVGKKISQKLPAYENILNRVIKNTAHKSFTAELDGGEHTIFSSETSNGWYMIISVDNFTLYQDSYRQMVVTILLSLVMLTVIVIFYLNGVKNRLAAEKALMAKEEFLSNLSKELRDPLNRILKISKVEELASVDNPAEMAAQVRESALQLSDMLDNLFSFSKIVAPSVELDNEEKARQGRELSQASRSARLGIIVILIFATTVSMALCLKTTMNWGDTKMSRDVDNYEYQMSNWIERQKSILSMFASLVAENPHLMDDYPSAVKYLDNLAKHYPEISVCYMANPYAEHQVIMNNGWESPDPNWRVDQRPWYLDAEKSDDGFNVSAPYLDDQTGFYCITFSQMVYGSSGEFLGIFAIDFFIDKLIHILDESYTRDNYAFLVDKNGTIINHPNRNYQLSTTRAVNIADTEYREVYMADSQVFALEDYSGKSVACLAKKNKTSDFTVIVANNWWHIYGSVVTLGAVFVLMLTICIISVVMLIERLLKWQQSVNLKLRAAAKEAIMAGRAKFQFLAQMSHEIRTPLNVVLGMNELILRENPRKEIAEYAENIQSAGKTLLTLINTILDFSKLDNGSMKIVPVRYDTAEMLDDLVKMTVERAAKKGLQFNLEIAPSLPRMLYGDDIRVKQVIMNLLSNAVKYTHDGSVTLKITGAEIDADTFELRVEVSDTGIGIRAEDIGKLSLSFQRLDEAKNRNIEGTGLGIAIVQKLLAMMDSKLEVASVYGEGSTFSFKLAQKIIDRAAIGEYHERTASKPRDDRKNKTYLKAKGAKILVVDDNAMNLKVLQGILKFNEIAPDLADSGQKCLELAAAKNYHIIFLDHMMPELDGLETLKKLKAEKLAEGAVIIALTANAISGAQQFYLRAGFDDYLSKPVNPDALESMLGKYLPPEILNDTAETAAETPAEEIPADTGDEDSFTAAEKLQLETICAEINADAAMSYCMNSKAFFIEMMQEFYADDKTASLAQSYDGGDWKNYRILVHALKSTSMVIGALKFSDAAKGQELTAKEGNIALLKKNHGDFMKYYAKVRAEIGEWLKVSGNANDTDS